MGSRTKTEDVEARARKMSEISVGLDRENRVNGRCVQSLQPPGGKDHLDMIEQEEGNNNTRIMHRITQPPGGRASDIFDPLDANGNVGRPYRMASSFELGDEQPEDNMENKWNNTGGTFHSLFGPPSPTLSKAEKARILAQQPSEYSLKPCKKPLPVNPLTGDILGTGGEKAPETPRKVFNPDSIPPGGRSTPIW